MEHRDAEDAGIRAMPLVIIALLLIVPFLNLDFTFYRMTIKLFVFQTAVTLLWCHLAFLWASGGLRAPAWPAWWLIAPLAAWVGWGLLTALWSPQPGLAATGVVQGVYGLFGAVGLAVLLREREAREMFIKAASAVVFVLALWMIVVYDHRAAPFFGDRDLLGPDVAAAFLLLPTLVAAGALYGARRDETGERDYRGVLWAALLLAVLLAAGLRTSVVAWVYAMGVGVAVVVWLLLPRWRVLAPLVLALVVMAAAQREMRQGILARDPLGEGPAVRRAVLDRADRRLWTWASPGRQLVGHGVGTYFVAYDRRRPLATYALRLGDGLVDHARRQVNEVFFERGIIGVLLALAAGAACVVAGVLCARRARDSLDAALAAGLAAGVVAMGVYACFSNGAIGFGASVAVWLGVGLLGALTVVHGREAGLGHSPEEEMSRAERSSMRRPGRLAAALGVGVVGVVLWFVVGARPFWAEIHLREGVEERKALKLLINRYKRLIARHEQFSPNEIRYLELLRRESEDQKELPEVADLRDKLPRKVVERLDAFRESVQTGREGLRHSAARTRDLLRDAAALSLGDRLWLTAQMNLLWYATDWYELDPRSRDEVLEIGRRLETSYGPLFTLDITRARFHVAIGQFEEAHRFFRRYARKNPFAAPDALRRSKTDVYQDWARMIATRHRAGDRRAAAWAWDLVDALQHGIRFDPTRYALMAKWGDLLYEMGRAEGAYIHMMRALDAIEEELAYPHPPEMQAELLLDAAVLNLPWDPELAFQFAGRISVLRIDFRKPENAWMLNRALAIAKQVGMSPPAPPPLVRAPRRRVIPAKTEAPKGKPAEPGKSGPP